MHLLKESMRWFPRKQEKQVILIKFDTAQSTKFILEKNIFEKFEGRITKSVFGFFQTNTPTDLVQLPHSCFFHNTRDSLIDCSALTD